MKELIGELILSVSVSRPGQHYIRFELGWQFNRKTLYYLAEPDCCSETWFADIINPQAIIGKVCTGYVYSELPNPDDSRGRQERDLAYGCRLYSADGVCDIIFRNSSNGYYGGSLSGPLGEIPALDYRSRESLDWETVTSDWQADTPTDIN